MNHVAERLLKAARQLIETQRLMGGDFLPCQVNPLPKISISAASAQQPAEVAGHSGRAAPSRSAAQGPARSAIVSEPPSRLAAPAAVEDFTPKIPPAEKATPEQHARKAAELSELKEKAVASCRKCVLCQTRTQIVFGEGNPAAQLVFIGEAPGADEDASGRPFVGRAGELLTNMITAMGLSRDDVYILNVVKCRPPQNRTPLPDETNSCRKYLIRQLEIIHPRVIVTLGNPATQNLLDTKIGITKLRGQWQKLPPIGQGLQDIPVMPTFHPAFVLRSYTPDVRGKVWDDLKRVMELLGIRK